MIDQAEELDAVLLEQGLEAGDDFIDGVAADEGLNAFLLEPALVSKFGCRIDADGGATIPIPGIQLVDGAGAGYAEDADDQVIEVLERDS